MALGFFDGVHKGHAAVIGEAVSQGMQTAVVTFNHHPGDRTLSPANIVPEITGHEIKEGILSSIGVDVTVYIEFDAVRDYSPEEFVAMLCTWFDLKYVSCGFNYHFGKGAKAGVQELARLCEERGAVAGNVEPVCIEGRPVSSTRIRSLLTSGDVLTAAELMGRPFSLYGEVIHGKQIGRTLGMPTMNQQFPATQLLPRYGVYASAVLMDGKRWPGVTSVGVKPTVGEDIAAGVETFIPGFSGNLYGKKLHVELTHFLRPEMRFSGLAELKAQMERDTQNALTVFENAD